jgi:uncharacterized protein YaiI (UPF0178 family)
VLLQKIPVPQAAKYFVFVTAAAMRLPVAKIAQHLRELGTITRGPAPLTKRDRSRFLSALDTALQAALREAAPS